jgi:hypothetical protein
MYMRLGVIVIGVGLALGSAAGQNASPAPPNTSDQFSGQAAEQVLSALRAGLVGFDFKRTLAVFDSEHMPGYAEFANRLQLMFRQYEAFRVRFHILQTVDEPRDAVVDFTLEAAPVTPPAVPTSLPPVRRSERLRFTFARAGNEWKIVDVQPRGFFSQF